MHPQRNSYPGSSESETRGITVEIVQDATLSENSTEEMYDRSNEQLHMEIGYPGPQKLCFCLLHAPRFTHWVLGENAGRRYFGCRNWTSRDVPNRSLCQYLEWYDDSFPLRATEVITQLQLQRDMLQHQLSSNSVIVPANASHLADFEIVSAITEMNHKLDCRFAKEFLLLVLLVAIAGIFLGMMLAVLLF